MSAAQAKAAAPFRDARGGLLNVFRTAVRSPRALASWTPLISHVLRGSSLTTRQTEIVILRTVRRKGCAYAWAQHVKVALGAGLSTADIDAIGRGEIPPSFEASDALLLGAADELHRARKLSAATRRALLQAYAEEQVIDLIVAAGQYATVSMLLMSCETPLEDA